MGVIKCEVADKCMMRRLNMCYRRALKAGFMLVPLFGLQLLLTVYRPDVAIQRARQYEYITIAITNSQVDRRLLLRPLPVKFVVI